MLHKSDTEDLFQETSPNPIKWAFLDEFSSDSCISQEKALKLTCPSVMRKKKKCNFLVTSIIFCRILQFHCSYRHTSTTIWFNRILDRSDHVMWCGHYCFFVCFFCKPIHLVLSKSNGWCFTACCVILIGTEIQKFRWIIGSFVCLFLCNCWFKIEPVRPGGHT